jgi:methyl-accepting chemotaxis protein WspA
MINQFPIQSRFKLLITATCSILIILALIATLWSSSGINQSRSIIQTISQDKQELATIAAQSDPTAQSKLLELWHQKHPHLTPSTMSDQTPLFPLSEDYIKACQLHLNQEHLETLSQQLLSYSDWSPWQLLLPSLLMAVSTALYLFSLPMVTALATSLKSVTQELQAIISTGANLTKRLPTDLHPEVQEICSGFNSLMDHFTELMRRIQRAGLQVFGSSNSISTASKQVESTVLEFSKFTQEVVAHADQIATVSQNLLKTTENVSQVATTTTELASSGQAGLGQIESTITQMEEAFRAIATKLEIISEKAANITTVVTTITKIADQTNLLSLNASIEAEKAGEVGLGFAVIARETRRLADQTAIATLDIDKMVSDMKSAVSGGVSSIENFSRQLNLYVTDVRQIALQQAQIITQVQRLTPGFAAVHTGMQSQAATANAIRSGILEIYQAAKKSNDALQHSSMAVEQLTAAARALQKEVAYFKLQ